MGFNKSNSLWKEKPVHETTSRVKTTKINAVSDGSVCADIHNYNILSPQSLHSLSNDSTTQESVASQADTTLGYCYKDMMLFVRTQLPNSIGKITRGEMRHDGTKGEIHDGNHE